MLRVVSVNVIRGFASADPERTGHAETRSAEGDEKATRPLTFPREKLGVQFEQERSRTRMISESSRSVSA